MSSPPEKISHVETETHAELQHSEHAEHHEDAGFGYLKSPMFIGTYLACGLSLFGGLGGFSLAAPILTTINADIGPSNNYSWIGLIYTSVLAIALTVVGRLSDIFGRRWFIIGGNVLAVVGCAIASQASSIPMLIGGSAVLGLAASVQVSFPFVIGELVPMKDRYLVTGLTYIWGVPTAALGAVLSYAFIAHTSAGWRWCYYLMLITNGLGTVLWFFFYHPPNFHMLRPQSRMELIKNIDWVGLILFSGGLLSFLFGLSWGGSTYPWDSGHVVGALVAGAVALIAFVAYECLAPLKEPLIPVHLFRNTGWVLNVVVTCLGASVYFGFSIVFPIMVFSVYTTDLAYGSILSCAVSASYLLGAICSAAARYIGKQKIQMVVAALIATPCLGAVGGIADVDNKGTTIALLVVGTTAIGYMEGISLTSTGICIDDQADIGAAIGVASTLRSIAATVAATVYFVILQNRQAVTVPKYVVPAVVGAGLPPTSIPGFFAGFTTGSFAGVPGVSPEIIAAGLSASKVATVMAMRTVFLATIAFSGLALILTVFCPNLDHYMTNEITVSLHKPKPIIHKRNDTENAAKVEAESI